MVGQWGRLGIQALSNEEDDRGSILHDVCGGGSMNIDNQKSGMIYRCVFEGSRAFLSESSLGDEGLILEMGSDSTRLLLVDNRASQHFFMRCFRTKHLILMQLMG